MKIYENLDVQDLDGEIWKIIEEYPDYQVSNFGRIKSFKKWHGTNERILKQNKDGDNYFQVGLCKNGKEKFKKVHRLVFETFKEKLKKGYDTHHINKHEEDNFLENLKTELHSKHMSDHHKGKLFSEEHKKKLSESHADFRGENHPNFGKGISNQKIIDIQIDIEKGDLTQREIAEKHGVCQMTVSKIKRGKIWNHIKLENI